MPAHCALDRDSLHMINLESFVLRYITQPAQDQAITRNLLALALDFTQGTLWFLQHNHSNTSEGSSLIGRLQIFDIHYRDRQALHCLSGVSTDSRHMARSLI